MRWAPPLPGWACAGGHAFLYRHDRCPRCGGALRARRLLASARLETCTTVRVNPSGDPFRLGLAVTDEGASTLCVVEGNIRGNGRDRVVLVYRGGRYVAFAPGWRATARSPERDPTPGR